MVQVENQKRLAVTYAYYHVKVVEYHRMNLRLTRL